MANPSDDVVAGTLDMLVLKCVELGPMHGWGMGDRLRMGSKGVLELNQGSLYPALYKLEKMGLLPSGWNPSETNPRARYSALTAPRRRALAAERAKWERQ